MTKTRVSSDPVLAFVVAGKQSQKRGSELNMTMTEKANFSPLVAFESL